MGRPCGLFGRSLRAVSWTAVALAALAVLSRRTRSREVAKTTPAEPGVIRGTVHALLDPRGLVVVDGLVEPARWLGAAQPPGRGGTVRLTRKEGGAGIWDAWPLEEPREGGRAA
ncbi:hypothetical protein [Streptomyces sp. NPDC007905]|uniref:hypothetical protein n=1 Tax=Streptomyces sp. NPDC007905 TaxID=3364788 RepID=UPI0036F03B63